jgi:hypothetical protein
VSVVAGGAAIGAAGSLGVVAVTSPGFASGSGICATGSVAGACATGAGCADSAGSVTGAVVVMVAVVVTALGASTLSGCGGATWAEAPAASPLFNGKRLPNESAGVGIAAGGIGLPAASCNGAPPAASRLNGSWLTRNTANTAKPQLSATTEATTAAIKRRTLGNIRPRITAARDLGRSTRH